jgi:hypothetical protein
MLTKGSVDRAKEEAKKTLANALDKICCKQWLQGRTQVEQRFQENYFECRTYQRHSWSSVTCSVSAKYVENSRIVGHFAACVTDCSTA